jgi:hypothetical protein
MEAPLIDDDSKVAKTIELARFGVTPEDGYE